MTLPAFASGRRAEAPLLLSAGACDRSISPASSSKSAARCCCDRQTDGRTDGHPTVTQNVLYTVCAQCQKSPVVAFDTDVALCRPKHQHIQRAIEIDSLLLIRTVLLCFPAAFHVTPHYSSFPRLPVHYVRPPLCGLFLLWTLSHIQVPMKRAAQSGVTTP